MTITTIDQAVAGLRPDSLIRGSIGAVSAPRWQNLFQISYGAVTPSSGLSGSAHTYPLDGCFEYKNSGASNSYAGMFSVSASGTQGCGIGILVDRLWSNSGITITSTASQTVNSVAWPARDNNGSTDGEGVYIALEVWVATAAGAPTITISYTNSAGTAGRTSSVSGTASTSTGSVLQFPLQAGDTGVRSIQSVQLSASWASGTICLVAYRPISFVEVDVLNKTCLVDPLTGCLPRLWDGSCLAAYFAGTQAQGIVTRFAQTIG